MAAHVANFPTAGPPPAAGPEAAEEVGHSSTRCARTGSPWTRRSPACRTGCDGRGPWTNERSSPGSRPEPWNAGRPCGSSWSGARRAPAGRTRRPPRREAAPPEETGPVTLWFCSNDELDPGLADTLARRWLDGQEQETAGRFLFPHDRRQYLVAHALVRRVLALESGLPEAEAVILRSPRGGPSCARRSTGCPAADRSWTSTCRTPAATTCWAWCAGTGSASTWSGSTAASRGWRPSSTPSPARSGTG
ncbi:hypothetical protein ACFQ60_46105 [Streptomyces zhihengii]